MATAFGGGPTAGIEPIGIELHQNELRNTDEKILERQWGIMARTDPTVTFEQYRYWAEIERAEELESNRKYIAERGPTTFAKVLKNRFSKGIHHDEKKKAEAATKAGNEKDASAITNTSPTAGDSVEAQPEWKTNARALRTASWGTIFYLITTDILGWSTCPFVFASVGYGPGVVLYFIFGVAASFSGWCLWRVYLALDSSRFPMMSFGDPFLRIYGPKTRHFINFAQALQQFMTVSVLILAAAQVIGQLADSKICFVVVMIIVTVAGCIFGSVRSLQRLGWICNLSVWLNIISFLIIMVAAANYGIDYEVVTSSTLIKKIEAVKTFAGPPPDAYQQQAYGFAAQFNGIDDLVYSYGGALLFIAFLAEMRHPMDFWKGLLIAQLFITIVYIFFGAFVYSQFGQYSASNIGQVILPVKLQSAGNILGLITLAIACLLYFNIGMKTVYIEVFQEIFKFPEITTKKGRWMWYLLGPAYWFLAFIVAAAVPNLNGISGLVGALLILNFTYTFPAILYIGFRCQVDAALPGEGFDPHTGVTTRHDSGLKRWTRGYLKNWPLNVMNTIYFLGGLVCSGMGSWAAIIGLIEVFGPGGTVASSFGCATPV